MRIGYNCIHNVKTVKLVPYKGKDGYCWLDILCDGEKVSVIFSEDPTKKLPEVIIAEQVPETFS